MSHPIAMNQSRSNLRRRRQHPAALEFDSRASEQGAPLSDDPLRRSTLRHIAHTLLVLDLATLRALHQFGEQEATLKFRSLVDKDPIASRLAERALSSTWQNKLRTSSFRRKFEMLSEEQLVARITESEKGKFHADALCLLKNHVQDAYNGPGACENLVSENTIVIYDDDLESDLLVDTYKGRDGCLILGLVLASAGMLLLLIRKAQTLQRDVIEAAEKDYLDVDKISTLIERLRDLDRYFEDACHTLDITAPSLFLLGGGATLKINLAPAPTTNSATGPSSVTTELAATSSQSRAPSIFACLVPIACLLSSILATLAWTRADSTAKGSAPDADFFQLLSSVPLQLLGIGISVWPATTSLGLNRTARNTTWGMALVSVGLTFTALPMYIFSSVRWSNLLMLGGAVLQALLQLQLVLGIYNSQKQKG